jgi:hypothetical protein
MRLARTTAGDHFFGLSGLRTAITSGNAVVMEKASMLAIAIPPPAALAFRGVEHVGTSRSCHEETFRRSPGALRSRSTHPLTGICHFGVGCRCGPRTGEAHAGQLF